jgi:predicted nucleic acid-binding protein
MIAISNAGPLIHLAQIGCLEWLTDLFEKVIIPTEVYNETVLEGKKNNYADAILIENLIKDGFIEVYNEDNEIEIIFQSEFLHKGELSAINLALSLDEEIILLDDEEARISAKRLKLKVKGTLGILIDIYTKKIISKEHAINSLKRINEIMYLSSDVYSYILEKLE